MFGLIQKKAVDTAGEVVGEYVKSGSSTLKAMKYLIYTALGSMVILVGAIVYAIVF